MMQIILDGTTIKTEMDLHSALSDSLDFGPYYGNNLSALWDRLSTDVERPVEIVWRDAAESRVALGPELFDRIVKLLKDVEEQDKSFGWQEQFAITLA